MNELEDDCTDIFKSNITERYSNRPQSNKGVDQLCLAKFASLYYNNYKLSTDEISDLQPDVLSDTVDEAQHSHDRSSSRLPTKIKLNYSTDALHIWAENKPVDEHNMKQFQNLPNPLFVLKAADKYPNNVAQQLIDKALSRGCSETGGLDSEISIKEGPRVMLTTNININDRLINGQMGTIVRIAVDQNGKPITVYVKFDDDKAGTMSIDKCSNSYAKNKKIVPI